ncbi:Transportin-1 [Hondaea fermentalgiana]|uniref:Transportin-1 n=1 Tax=Hondaea fermentalgiana TaxID=2315210 RepID=A0A2R5GZ32_9STRA|nr:Transportin-1 [Hondaea fermentalgiana]|eukprot:GBG33274.1 Transportin-1 [Hondaea fermentalgiana]
MVVACALGGGWAPEEGTLQQLMQLLEATQRADLSNEEHRKIQQEVDLLAHRPEFVRYLSYLFAESQALGSSETQRQMASLVLLKAVRVGVRNNVATPDGLAHVQRSVLQELTDASPVLRRSAQSLASTIAVLCGVKAWPDLLNFLHSALTQTQDENVFSGALRLLKEMCDEGGDQLVDESESGSFLPTFLPILMQHFENPVSKYRILALQSVNQLMSLDPLPPLLSTRAEDLLGKWSALAQDAEAGVRKEVCRGLTLLAAANRFDILAQHLDSISQFMLSAIDDQDESVAFEACDFWNEVCAEPIVAQRAVEPHLAGLLPALLRRMKYSDEELMMLGFDDDENDTSVPDRKQDIRPSVHGVDGDHDGDASQTKDNNGGDGDNEDEDDEDEGDDEDDEKYYSIWTIRKSAGSALNAISDILDGNQVLPILVPLLEAGLQPSNDWRTREVVVMALGAVGEAYHGALDPHMPNLVPFLVQQARSGETPLRITTLWTLSKLSQWVIAVDGTGKPGDGLFREYVLVLTQSTADRNKNVQHAACSGLSTFIEFAGERVGPYVGDMAQALMQAYAIYQVNSRKSMLDVIGTLCESAPESMMQPHVVGVVLPPLWQDFERLDNTDTFALNFLETFACLERAIGPAIGPAARPLYNRCMTWIEEALTMLMTCEDMGLTSDDIEKDFMYDAMEMLSAFVEGLEQSFAELWDADQFMSLLHQLFKVRDAVTLQLAIELSGELIKVLPHAMEPILPQLVQIMTRCLIEPDDDIISVHVVSNALWVFGHLALQLGANARTLAQEPVARMALLLQADSLEDRIRINAAITLGRFALHCADAVAPHLDGCARAWCIALKRMSKEEAEIPDDERCDCLSGFLACVRANPAAMRDAFSYFANMLVSSSTADSGPEVAQASAEALEACKQALKASGQWESVYNALNVSVARELQSRQMLAP